MLEPRHSLIVGGLNALFISYLNGARMFDFISPEALALYITQYKDILSAQTLHSQISLASKTKNHHLS